MGTHISGSLPVGCKIGTVAPFLLPTPVLPSVEGGTCDVPLVVQEVCKVGDSRVASHVRWGPRRPRARHLVVCLATVVAVSSWAFKDAAAFIGALEIAVVDTPVVVVDWPGWVVVWR